MITTKTYRLTLSKRNGKILGLVDRASGLRLARNTNRCLWGVAANSNRSYVGGCSFAPRCGAPLLLSAGTRATATLTLTYRGFGRRHRARAPDVPRLAAADREPRRCSDPRRVPGGSRGRHGNGDSGIRADRSARRASSRRRSSHASATTFSSIRRAGRSPTISRSTSAPRTSLSTRSRVDRSIRCSSASSTRRRRRPAPARRSASSTSSRRGSSEARPGRAPSFAFGSAPRPSSRSSRTGTTTGSTRTRRCRASSVRS